MSRLSFIVFLALLVGACAHVRPAEVADCRYSAIPLFVGNNHPRGIGGRAIDESPFQQEAIGILTRSSRGMTDPAHPEAREILVLSGGSQHGLFGTGFMLGLSSLPPDAQGRPPIPTYDIVTGVSTGALQSTFLFLANEPVLTDRVYPDDLGFDPDIPRHASNVADLALASSVTREANLLHVGSFGIVGGVARGAVGSLDPLRQRAFRFISPQTIDAVAAANGQGRRLYVGVTDMDDGDGYAIDLTELASRTVTDKSPALMEMVRHCYVDALIASSSVPLGAYPVSLGLHPTRPLVGAVDRHDLFIDGGARYGVFLHQLQNAARAIGRPTNLTLIVNGGLYSGEWQDGQSARPAKWSAISLGLRAVSLLENQVYRFSVEDVERTDLHGGTFRMAFISNEDLPPGAEEPDAHHFQGSSCADWSKEDDRHAVVEFHPHYMACLLDYGRTRGRHQLWNRGPPTIPPGPPATQGEQP